MSASKYLVTSVKVQINAPASLVWKVLVDMEKHGPWVKQGFDAVAHSLKARAEQLYALA